MTPGQQAAGNMPGQQVVDTPPDQRAAGKSSDLAVVGISLGQAGSFLHPVAVGMTPELLVVDRC
jgi:hypothetical protein